MPVSDGALVIAIRTKATEKFCTAAVLVLWNICSQQELWSERKPLLANGSETTFVLGNHVLTETDTHATVEVLLETGVFYSVRAKGL
jgi:hypothetical protein